MHAKAKALLRVHHDQSSAIARLYTGVTGHLVRRVFQHKNKLVPGFTSRYNLTQLVCYEQFVYPDAAIAREKEIKGWRRSKKIRLIESMNPLWRDLSDGWWDQYKPTKEVTSGVGELGCIGSGNGQTSPSG